MAFVERGKATAFVIAKEESVEADEILANDPRDLFDNFPGLASRFYQSLILILAQQLRDTSRELMRVINSAPFVSVTHEHDIAEFAKRVLVFRDGTIRKDEPVVNRPQATEVLKTLPTLED